MYRWLAEKVARWSIGQLVSGQPERIGRLLAPEVRFVFPGTSSFATERVGREGMLAWMRRFSDLRPDYRIVDVLASGPPWNTRLAVRFEDRIGDDYRNQGMQYLRLRWGRVVLDQVYLDTEAITAWEERHPELVATG